MPRKHKAAGGHRKFDAILIDVLAETNPAQVDGRRKRMSNLEAIALQLLIEASRGNVRAASLLRDLDAARPKRNAQNEIIIASYQCVGPEAVPTGGTGDGS